MHHGKYQSHMESGRTYHLPTTISYLLNTSHTKKPNPFFVFCFLEKSQENMDH